MFDERIMRNLLGGFVENWKLWMDVGGDLLSFCW
jgi:hypothetical protein